MSETSWTGFELAALALMEECGIVGAAVAVSQGPCIVYARGLGVKDHISQLPVTPQTVFGIASVTKSFTALAIMQLVGDGRLSLHDPVQNYLPDFTVAGGGRGTITLHHLLSHTSGLPPLPRREDLPDFAAHLQQLAIGDYRLLGEPGEYFSYANDAFLLLGAIIEGVSGEPYRHYMREHILQPLGMQRTTFNLDELATWSDVTKLYVREGEAGELRERPWPQLGNYDVGGGLRSTVMDLLRYGQMYLNGGGTEQEQLVDEAVLKSMWRPVYPLEPNRFYGYALQVTLDYQRVRVVEHGGSQVGVSAHFGFVPERQLVVAVLANVTNVPADRLWWGALNTALGLPFEQTARVLPEAPPYPIDLSRYLGIYASGEGARVQVMMVDDQLTMASEEGSFSLLGGAEHRFAYQRQGGWRLVSFYLREDKPAWAVFHGMRVLRRVVD